MMQRVARVRQQQLSYTCILVCTVVQQLARFQLIQRKTTMAPYTICRRASNNILLGILINLGLY